MKSSNTSTSHLFVSAVLALMLLLTNVGTVAAAPLSKARKSCDRAVRFSRDDFPHPTTINNEFMPLIPGTQLVFNGVISTSGQVVDHQVIFTVTDLIKIINGVRTRVIYDVDVNQGEVAEAELAFFAQDEDSNVWNLGEYPEEYEGGEFVGAPSTWIAGQAGAKGGIHMFGKPLSQLGKSTYLQGIAPDIEFLDCGQVVDKDQSVNGYDDVLVTYETSPLDPEGGIQIKYYAPGVGIVQIGALDDPEAETMVLNDVVDLNANQMDQIRAEALALDSHAYEVSEVYQSTPPAYKHHQDDGGSGGVSAGTYDDSDSAWTYTGGWATYSGSGPYNNTLHYTSTVGDAAELTFSGTKFTLLFTKDFNRGSIDVYVDGNKVTTVNAYSASYAFQQSYTSPSFTAGNHTLRLVHAGDGAYIDIDAIQIFGAPTAVPAGTYDDTDAAWGYSGNWALYSDSGPYNSTLHYTSTIGDAAELTFSGTKFTLLFTKDFNRGSIDVYVDGNKIATVDAYSALYAFQQSYTSPSFTAGNHTLRLVHAGNGAYIDIDAITILP